jgi:hypothetical protein
VTNESTREIDRLCVRLDQAEAEVERLRAVLTSIAEYREIAWDNVSLGVVSTLAIDLCRLASEALKEAPPHDH